MSKAGNKSGATQVIEGICSHCGKHGVLHPVRVCGPTGRGRMTKRCGDCMKG